MKTVAEGVATRTAFELPLGILRHHLNDFVLLREDAIRDATRRLIETTRNLCELSGGIALAAAESHRDDLRGKKVVVVQSGANIAPDALRDLMS